MPKRTFSNFLEKLKREPEKESLLKTLIAKPKLGAMISKSIANEMEHASLRNMVTALSQVRFLSADERKMISKKLGTREGLMESVKYMEDARRLQGHYDFRPGLTKKIFETVAQNMAGDIEKGKTPYIRKTVLNILDTIAPDTESGTNHYHEFTLAHEDSTKKPVILQVYIRKQGIIIKPKKI